MDNKKHFFPLNFKSNRWKTILILVAGIIIGFLLRIPFSDQPTPLEKGFYTNEQFIEALYSKIKFGLSAGLIMMRIYWTTFGLQAMDPIGVKLL